MRNLITFLLAFAVYAALHEGAHALTALAFGEYDAFHVRVFGLEVTYRTPVEERAGFKWALISGTGSVVAIALGYGLYALRRRLAALRNRFAAGLGFWLSVLFLIVDPLNLSVGSLIYGGDATGIAAGLNVSRMLVQVVFLVVFLVNREIVARRLLPGYGVETRHPLFRPWLPRPAGRTRA